MSGTEISFVLIVCKVHRLQQEELSIFSQYILLSLHMIIVLKQVQPVGYCLVLMGGSPLHNHVEILITNISPSWGDRTSSIAGVGNFLYTSGTEISTVFMLNKAHIPQYLILGHEHWLKGGVSPWWVMCSDVFLGEDPTWHCSTKRLSSIPSNNLSWELPICFMYSERIIKSKLCQSSLIISWISNPQSSGFRCRRRHRCHEPSCYKSRSIPRGGALNVTSAHDDFCWPLLHYYFRILPS